MIPNTHTSMNERPERLPIMTTLLRSRRRTSLLRATVGVALALFLLSPVTAAFAEGDDDDPNLDQTLDDLAVVHGERVLDAGHVDMGPKFVDGEWTFLIHDDAARADANATSVWRYPDETVLHVLDAGELIVPDDPAYKFIGAAPSEPVWVIPQTQNPDVVWLGWNTQDPEVMTTIDRGVTLSLTGVQGPGVVTTYLQSGSFGEPQLLWDSRIPEPQPAWVDVNTHTHANWVFTEPGVYLLRLQADADLVDGTTVTDTQLIRVAVGTATSPVDALAATWDDAKETTSESDSGAEQSDVVDEAPVEPGTADDPIVPILIGVIALVAAGLIIGFIVVIVRGNHAKKRILASRATGNTAREEHHGADNTDTDGGEQR